MSDVIRRFGEEARPAPQDDAMVLAVFFLCTLATILLLSPPVLGDTLPTAVLVSALITALLCYVHSHAVIETSFRCARTVFRS